MSRVGGLGMHRGQLIFDCLDTLTGALRRGKITLAGPALREWLGRLADYRVGVVLGRAAPGGGTSSRAGMDL